MHAHVPHVDWKSENKEIVREEKRDNATGPVTKTTSASSLLPPVLHASIKRESSKNSKDKKDKDKDANDEKKEDEKKEKKEKDREAKSICFYFAVCFELTFRCVEKPCQEGKGTREGRVEGEGARAVHPGPLRLTLATLQDQRRSDRAHR